MPSVADPALLSPLIIALPAILGVLVLLPGGLFLRAVPLAGGPVVGLPVALLTLAVVRDGPALTALGGWERPLGIALRADGLAVLFLCLATLVLWAIICYALGERRRGKEARVFWSLLFFLWAGLNTAFLSHDLFNLYVALEIAGLSGVALVALSGEAAALRAQMRYLLLATLGSLFYLLGVALIYAELGVLDLGLVGERLEPSAPALAAAGVMTLGLLLKTAIWPLHFWLPPAHGSAQPPVSAALSGLVTKASLYLLVRLWFDVFSALPVEEARLLLGGLGAVAVLWGSLLALRQERLKLMIAYSTVAQLGYMLFVFPLALPGSAVALQAWNGALLQMLSHGLAKASMFLSAGAIVAVLGSDRREALLGGSRRVPLPLFALALAGLSIMALPPSGGFLAKWLLLQASIAAGQWWLAVVLMVGGLLAAGYLFRFLLPAFRPPPEDAPPLCDAGSLLGLSGLGLALLSLLLGLGAEPVLRLIEATAPAGIRGLP